MKKSHKVIFVKKEDLEKSKRENTEEKESSDQTHFQGTKPSSDYQKPLYHTPQHTTQKKQQKQ
jgi:hypothetical protein